MLVPSKHNQPEEKSVKAQRLLLLPAFHKREAERIQDMHMLSASEPASYFAAMMMPESRRHLLRIITKIKTRLLKHF